MSDEWVNWQQFADLNKTDVQRQGEERERAARLQGEQMQKALSGLGDTAMGLASQGAFRGVESINGYSDLMAQRDAALQRQTPQQQVAPWESELTKGQKPVESPWMQLSTKLAGLNNKAGQRQTREQNDRAYAAQQDDIRRYQAAQKAKMDEAMHGKRNREAEDYARWSDSVNRNAQNNRGSGVGAYYDAGQGYGPQPVRGYQSQTTREQQRKLGEIQQDQIMPPSSKSGFEDGWW